MNQNQTNAPSEGQIELITFINPVDAKDIADSLTKVFWAAIFSNDDPITAEEKGDLFILKKVITYADKISEH